MKKTVLSLAFIAAMGTTFVACDNQNEQVEPLPQDAEVQIGMSVFSGKSAQNAPAQYASANDVYFDGQNTAGIKNIFVVPMKNDVAQKPVQLEDLGKDITKSANPTTLTVNTETNRFLVYANLRKSILTGTNFDTNTTFGINVKTDEHKSDLDGYYIAHKVYLFADAYKTFKVASSTDWSSVTDWSDYTENTQLGSETGQMNCIKIEKVTYAVGTLAAAVYHGDYTDKKVYVGEDTEGTDLNEAWLNNNITFVGITVDKQHPEFDYLFKPKGNYIGIFDPVSGDAQTIKTKGSDKLNFTNAASIANTFIPVAPFDGGDVVVNVVCRNDNEKPIKFGDNRTKSAEIPRGARFFLAAKLSPRALTESGESFVFKEGYTTLLNATINKWEKATTKPQTSVDVQIGIEVDLTWKEGITYNEDI